MEMDWEKEASSQGELIAEGYYVLQIRKWEQEKSKKKGTDQIKWTLDAATTEGPVTVYDYHALLPQSLWRIANFVKAAKVDTAGMKRCAIPSPVFSKVLDACLGRKIGANVVIEEYQGTKRNKFNEYVGVEKKPIKPNVLIDADLPEFLDEQEPPEEELS